MSNARCHYFCLPIQTQLHPQKMHAHVLTHTLSSFLEWVSLLLEFVTPSCMKLIQKNNIKKETLPCVKRHIWVRWGGALTLQNTGEHLSIFWLKHKTPEPKEMQILVSRNNFKWSMSIHKKKWVNIGEREHLKLTLSLIRYDLGFIQITAITECLLEIDFSHGLSWGWILL